MRLPRSTSQLEAAAADPSAMAAPLRGWRLGKEANWRGGRRFYVAAGGFDDDGRRD